MLIAVDRAICKSRGCCLVEAPEVFQLDENDELVVLLPQPSESLRQKVENAVRFCPTGALSLLA